MNWKKWLRNFVLFASAITSAFGFVMTMAGSTEFFPLTWIGLIPWAIFGIFRYISKEPQNID